MRILIVTDAWEPQVNGVVRTLKTTAGELGAMGHEVRFLTPLEFRTLPCPTYPEIRLSLFPQPGVNRVIREFDPDVLHIATEGPLGLAARRHALRNDLPFTTAYHTRFPEYVHARLRLPLSWSYAWLRRFHGAGKAVMAPTQVVVDDLVANGFRNVRLWSRGVDQSIFHPQPSKRLDSNPPIYLYVGRVAVEKNVEAFLALDLPGSKWVVGTGPALVGLKARFPAANYLGLLDREELAKVYAAADVFVFPSKTDTFGLVLLEAMACGLPVAAYPVTGPRDVIGDSKAGVLHEDLRTACLDALKLKREDAVARAGLFTWRAATEQFVGHLHPRQRSAPAGALAGDAA
ncbi:MAG TPA: glycosyltransferase family 1 protein [Steroidobacteraceae bacterium]|nr:glycosyltransferase family 1 protein [Steroidobacteraceae bacterium]